MNKMTKEFRDKIAEMFIKSLEENQLQWKKNWKALNVLPQNAVTGAAYRGANRFFLSILCEANGWQDPRFATFNQIKDKGWHLNRGSKGVKVEYWMPYDLNEEKFVSWKDVDIDSKDIRIVPKYFTVFNAKDIDGIPPLPVPEKKDIKPDEILKTICKNMNIEILNDGKDRAFYRPSEDKVHLPEPGYFESDYAYNSVAMHELAHATGAEHRLNRNILNLFGSPDYAFEELVAEISSAFMSQDLAACVEDYEMDNHKAYVQSWIAKIKEKPDILMQAIKEANKAADYLEEAAELVPKREKESSIEVDAEKIVEIEPETRQKSEMIKSDLQEEREKEIIKELVAKEYEPSKKLVKNILELDKRTGQKHSLADINKLSKTEAFPYDEGAKKLVEQIAKECRAQEMALCQ